MAHSLEEGWRLSMELTINCSRLTYGRGTNRNGYINDSEGLEQAESQGIVDNQFWSYNGKATTVDTIGKLDPWRECWATTIP